MRLTELAVAVDALAAQVNREGQRERARQPVLDAVRHSAVFSDAEAAGLGPSERVLVAQLHSIALDLLQATGLSRDDARAAVQEPNPS